MVKYLEEYAEYLLLVKSDGTSIAHYTVIYEFLYYIFGYHLTSNIDQITVSIANAKFYANYKQRYKDDISSREMRQILKGFLLSFMGNTGLRMRKSCVVLIRLKNLKSNN